MVKKTKHARREFPPDIRSSKYRGHQTSPAVKGCAQWLKDWDAGREVASIRIAMGGPVHEMVSQMLVVAVVRACNGKMPCIEIAFIKHGEYFRVLLEDQGFAVSDGMLGGAINWAYWLLREGPQEALTLYPAISWQKVSKHWPMEPRRGD